MATSLDLPQLPAHGAGKLPAEAGSEPAVNHSRATRIGWWALAIGLGLFVLWAAFAPLDEGVPATGQVAIDTKRKTVQHLSGGIVREVLVREGSRVKEGDVLLRLDTAAARASYEATRQRYLGLLAMQGRLEAEQAGTDRIRWHPDLEGAANDPLIRQQMLHQEQLLRSRRSTLRAEVQSLEENIRGQQALIDAYQAVLASRRSQVELVSEELRNTRDLVKDGYAPRNRQLELERSVAEATASISDLQGNIARGMQTIAELRQRIVAVQQQYRKETDTSMADVTREVLADAGKVTALRDELERTEIRAPASGQVVALAVQTVGAVITPGQKLMDIVPPDEPLLLETRVAPHLIDRVTPGLPVDVRFNAFAHSPQLVVDGKIVSVSEDLLTDPVPNAIPYYLARVEITPEGMEKLGGRVMRPGMPVEVVFRTGERSLLTYLLHPLIKRVAASMNEE